MAISVPEERGSAKVELFGTDQKRSQAIAWVKEVMSSGPWQARLEDATRLVEDGAVDLMHGTVRSKDRTYSIDVDGDPPCPCKDAQMRSKYCKHYVALEMEIRVQNRMGGKEPELIPAQPETEQPAADEPPANKPISERQRAFLHDLLQETGCGEEESEKILSSIKTSSQASDMINTLRKTQSKQEVQKPMSEPTQQTPPVDDLDDPQVPEGTLAVIEESLDPRSQQPRLNRKILEQKFDQSLYRKTKGVGRMLDYIPAKHIIQRLNDASNGEWSFEIIEWKKFDKEVVVLGKMTLCGIVKMQFGETRINFSSTTGEMLQLGDDFKKAATDALKKCATLFGVALHLYDDDEERQEGSPPATQNGRQETGELASESQVKAIFAIGYKKGFTRDQIVGGIKEKYGKEPDSLTKRQASSIIELWSKPVSS